MRPLVRAVPCAVAILAVFAFPASAGTPLPPIRTPTDADITFAKTARTVKVDSRARFTFTFGARAGTEGSVTFSAAKNVLKLGTKGFTVRDDGTATVRYRLSRADRATLGNKKSVTVTATVGSTSGETATRKFALKHAR